MDQRAAKAFILAELKEKLPPGRSYHSLAHTLDVYASAICIGEAERVGGEDMELLKTAALFHDSGYITGGAQHEAGSCLLARTHLPRFGYTEHQVEVVCATIMATEIPQAPKDLLGHVLCDADLDYLGRPDFFRIGNLLFQEMKAHGALNSEREWQELQERFLAEHRYFTATSQELREPMKQRHLATIRRWLAQAP